MNREDLADFLGLIDSYSPGFASKDRVRAVAAVWFHQMQEVPIDVATAAVHAHYATETRWLMPADVRRFAATRAGVLPPDPAAARAQAIALRTWYGPAGVPLPDPSTRPTVHPAVQATINIVGIEQACSMSFFDWRASYAPRVEEFEQRALIPGGIPAAHREIIAPPPRPRPALEAPPAPETFEKAVELRSRREGDIGRLDAAIASLGADARFLLPKTTRLESRFGQAALRHKMRDFGADHDLDEAMRRARLEIARHTDSTEAADFEARRAAALRALEAMGDDGTEATA